MGKWSLEKVDSFTDQSNFSPKDSEQQDISIWLYESLNLSYLVGEPSFNIKRSLSLKTSERIIPLGQVSSDPQEISQY